MKTNKRGISLIVLVITIIVMIILATAIILSLNSSNISGKASEAKLSSDLANKKEAASVYVAEYEIKKAKGKIDSSITLDEYVKSQCNKSGIDTEDIAVLDNGTILVGIAAQFVNNDIDIGTSIYGYKLNNTTSYTTSGNEDTYTTNKTELPTLTRDENITWKYMGIDENGEVLLVGSVTSNSPKMLLGSKGGYLNGPQELNAACDAMYSSSMGTARSININDVIRVLKYTGERGAYYRADTGEYQETIEKLMTIDEIAQTIKYDMGNFGDVPPETEKNIGSYISDGYIINRTSDAGEYNATNSNLIYPGESDLTARYFLASSCVSTYFNLNYARFSVRCVDSNKVNSVYMWYSNNGKAAGAYAIRPVVSLNVNVQLKYENSTWVIY